MDTMRDRIGFVWAIWSLFVIASASTQTASYGQAAQASAAVLSSAARPTFEVATVRPSAPLDMQKIAADIQAGKMPKVGMHVIGLRAEYNYLTLKDLITVAYKVKPYQISGPAWLAGEHFDVAAVMPEGSAKDDAPKMLQALLEERFKLVLHRETQELENSPAAPAPIDPDEPLKPGEIKMDGPDGQVRMTTHKDGSFTENMGVKGTVTGKMDMVNQTMHMVADTLTMEGFADAITSLMQMGGGSARPVVDMTGLKGNYQVALEFSLADMMAMARAQGMNVPSGTGGGGASGPGPAAVASDPGGAGTSVYKSVEALGLKLEQRKAPVEQLVVDSAEKTPTEN
jgi:uncharacterized protein (TIGR03435 family)